jgi:hypothetical protein
MLLSKTSSFEKAPVCVRASALAASKEAVERNLNKKSHVRRGKRSSSNRLRNKKAKKRKKKTIKQICENLNPKNQATTQDGFYLQNTGVNKSAARSSS